MTPTRVPLSRADLERDPEAFEEDGAIGQTGHRVVDRLVRDPLGDRLAFGDVFDLRDHVAHAPVGIGHRGGMQRGPHDVAVGVDVALLELVARDLTRRERTELVDVGVPVVGMGDRRERQARELSGCATEHLRERGVHADDHAVGSRHRDADRRVLERDLEPGLGLGELGFDRAPFRQVAEVDHDAADRRLLGEVGSDDLHRYVVTVGVERPDLERRRSRPTRGTRRRSRPSWPDRRDG